MKRQIHKQEIHHELKRAARLLRFIIPVFTPKKMKFAKKMCRLLHGRHGKDILYEQIYIPRSGGGKFRICVYRPLIKKENAAGLLWLHGGGYAFGAPEQDESYIRRFIEASDCVVVAPDYTLSFDAPYPAAINDCYDALLWLKENGEKYGMRPDQIFIGGNSAGGGLCAALSLYARDKGEVSVAYQMPLYPMLDDRPTPSSIQNDAPMWNTKSNNAAWRLYLGQLYGAKSVSQYAAPARAENLRDLPPACTYVGDIEPFYDETVLYVKRLREAGVEVSFKIFEGCFHAFDFLCGKTDIGKEAANFLMDNFNYALKNYFAPQKEWGQNG